MEWTGMTVYNSYTDPLTKMLERELILQGRPTDDADVVSVKQAIVAVLASADFREGLIARIFAVLAEWMARSNLTLSGSDIDEMTADIAVAYLAQAQDAAKTAYKKLHSRRMKNPLLFFTGTAGVQGDHITAKMLLNNIDTKLTDCHSVVLLTRFLWPENKDQVFDFVRHYYTIESSTGLQDKVTFQKIWDTKFEQIMSLEYCLTTYIHIGISAHPFIRMSLPVIMNSPVERYSQKSKTMLRFSLDQPPTFGGKTNVTRAKFKLEYETRAITKLDAQGVHHTIFTSNVRAYFMQPPGVQAMACLLKEENIASVMRHDSILASWRIYDPATGIWPVMSAGSDVNHASKFLRKLLCHVLNLAEFIGPTKFDWVRGIYEPEAELSDGDGAGLEDGGASEKPAKKKRLCKSSLAGKHSVRSVNNAIAMFVETPKHTRDVLKVLMPMLEAPFLQSDKADRLVCPNGVVNLRTGELLPVGKPDDLYTKMCATTYNPSACVKGAESFFAGYFPAEAYPDHLEYLRCQQQWYGYCITGETCLEQCMWNLGEGSNGKSQMINIFAHVLGKDIHAQIPMASLCKPRGVNNDALYDARQVRLVTISESDSSNKINEASHRSLVSGEDQTMKTMYGKEVTCGSTLKFTFMINAPPRWENPGAFCSVRRNIYLLMRKMYIDPNDDSSEKKADELKATGLPACMIMEKDTNFFERNVRGQEEGFLRFLVQGSMAFYALGKKVQVPDSLNVAQVVQNLDKDAAVEDYFSEHMQIVEGDRAFMPDVIAHFREMTKIQALSLQDREFEKMFQTAIDKRGCEASGLVRIYRSIMKDGRRGLVVKHMSFVLQKTGMQLFVGKTDCGLTRLANKTAVKGYIQQNIRYVDGEKTLLRDILKHFREIALIDYKSLTDTEFPPLFQGAVNEYEDWQGKVLYRNSQVSDGRRGMVYTNLIILNPLANKTAVKGYIQQNIRYVDGEKTLLRDILKHFREIALIDYKSLTDTEFPPLFQGAVNENEDWQGKVLYRNSQVSDGTRGMVYTNLIIGNPMQQQYAGPAYQKPPQKRKEPEPCLQTMQNKDRAPGRFSDTPITFAATTP